MPFSRPKLPVGGYGYLDGLPKLALKPDDFDVATAKVLVRGDRTTLTNLFKPASVTSGIGNNLFCTGPTVEREQWGHVWADVEWKGFVDAHDMLFSHTVTTRETLWPQTIDGVEYWVPGSMFGKISHINPNTGKPYRVRLVDQLSGVSVRGIVKGSAVIPPGPPLVGGGGTVGGIGTIGGHPIAAIARQQSFSGLLNPVYNAPRGWVLKNYDIQQSIALGNGQALYFWTANYDWAYDYGP